MCEYVSLNEVIMKLGISPVCSRWAMACADHDHSSDERWRYQPDVEALWIDEREVLLPGAPVVIEKFHYPRHREEVADPAVTVLSGHVLHKPIE